MNDKELQKIIDTKNSTISVLKDTVKKWVREYNMLDACIELQNEKINAYKMSENEANEIIAVLKAENERLKQQFAEFIKSISQPVLLPDVPIEVTNKYKQTLQEIKGIAETYLTDCQGFKCDAMEEILQKITKAEEE